MQGEGSRDARGPDTVLRWKSGLGRGEGKCGLGETPKHAGDYRVRVLGRVGGPCAAEPEQWQDFAQLASGEPGLSRPPASPTNEIAPSPHPSIGDRLGESNWRLPLGAFQGWGLRGRSFWSPGSRE